MSRSLNAILKGLQERLHLTKFVSDEAHTAVEKADLKGLALGGERKEATVLFSDIRRFTSMSEKMESEEVVKLLNIYFDKETEIVQNFEGDIDKFVGNELMAMFKGDKMANQAVDCAIKIQSGVQRLNLELGENIEICIGINTGTMVMGAMGSMDRMDFTVIGDNVNWGSHLCGAAKAGKIIFSENTEKILITGNYKIKN